MSNCTVLSTLGLCFAIAVSQSLLAEDTPGKLRGLKVGERAPVTGVYFAVGAWAGEHRMTCPAARRGNEPKIAIYTMTLNDNLLNLALAVDRLIALDAALKWSFVSVSDEKGGNDGVLSPDYYSRDELAQRLLEVKEAVAGKGIEQLTFGITSTGAAKEREKLGMSVDDNVLVAFLDGDRRTTRLVKFVKSIHSSRLDADMIESLLADIQSIRSR